jgi:hypothetical protein
VGDSGLLVDDDGNMRIVLGGVLTVVFAAVAMGFTLSVLDTFMNTLPMTGRDLYRRHGEVRAVAGVLGRNHPVRVTRICFPETPQVAVGTGPERTDLSKR